MSILPPTTCKLGGYTDAEIAKIVGTRMADFHQHMYGQTVARCTGVKCDTAHGFITYTEDVRTFLLGLSPHDAP